MKARYLAHDDIRRKNIRLVLTEETKSRKARLARLNLDASVRKGLVDSLQHQLQSEKDMLEKRSRDRKKYEKVLESENSAIHKFRGEAAKRAAVQRKRHQDILVGKQDVIEQMMLKAEQNQEKIARVNAQRASKMQRRRAELQRGLDESNARVMKFKADKAVESQQKGRLVKDRKRCQTRRLAHLLLSASTTRTIIFRELITQNENNFVK